MINKRTFFREDIAYTPSRTYPLKDKALIDFINRLEAQKRRILVLDLDLEGNRVEVITD